MATYDLTSGTLDTNYLIEGDIINCPYTGSGKSIALPAGTYKLECWGAEGGYRSSQTYSGKGGYATGVLTLTSTSKTTLYLYAGGSGGSISSNKGAVVAGGFNGGGYRYGFAGGGGGSDIRIGSDSLYSRVIVAGGGGSDGASNKKGMYGGGEVGGTTTESYTANSSYCGVGGNTTYSGYSSSYTISTQATSGLTSNSTSYYCGGFGFGGGGVYLNNGYGGAGGGGWYGGAGSVPDSSADDDRGGGGGSGYVYTSTTYSNYPSGCTLNSNYYLTNTSLINGNTSFKSPTGMSETGHIGHGYCRITVQNIAFDLISTSSIAVGSVYNSDYTGKIKGIDLPAGTYKLECWGAEGGYRSSSSYAGKGGYAAGTIKLYKNTRLFIYVGGSGNTGGTAGGFNGGGKRYSYNGGGGASDIRVGTKSLYSRVIVAGGGGSDGSTSKGGGAGGGETAQNTTASNYGTGGYGGTQTGNSGGDSYKSDKPTTSVSNSTDKNAGFGFGGNGIYYASGYGGAGGGGWYGGVGTYPDGSGDDDKGGGGGSGYVYTSSTAVNYPAGCTLHKSHYLTNTSNIIGTSSFTSPSGSSETGHSGNGYVRITVLTLGVNVEMPIKVNGTWKTGKDMYIKVSGTWRHAKKVYVKCDGVWREQLQGE